MASAIIGVGTATPKEYYTQSQIFDLLGYSSNRVKAVFVGGGIHGRHISMTPCEGFFAGTESQGMLLKRHRAVALQIGIEAIQRCLHRAGKPVSEIAFLCCVTTTGLLTPGISALLCAEMGLATTCVRLDVVGMGCNAGLNSLNAASAWTTQHPGKLGVLLCVEICSAAYMIDEQMSTAVVNSLFGDGAAAVALVSPESTADLIAPVLLAFRSRLIPDTLDAMRYDWDDGAGKYRFFLSADIPYVIGQNVQDLVEGLLREAGVRRSAIKHWIVHSGGKKVIDAVRVNLGLSYFDLRHSRNILRRLGNVSSGSFLFSLELLQLEGGIEPGDYGVMLTMGPGATIESALLRW